MKTIKVVIADDHILFANSLAGILDYSKDINVLYSARNGKILLERLDTDGPKPDVILMDLQMPVMDGIQTTKEVKAKYPEIKIIVITMHTDESYIVAQLENDVEGYLFKDNDTQDVRDAVRKVYNGGKYYINEVVDVSLNEFSKQKKLKKVISKFSLNFSERELEILRLLCQAKTSVEISEKLHISHRTIEGYRRKLLKKTKTKNTTALVIYAIKHGLAPASAYPDFN